MHILLTDRLTCPRCGPRFGLVLLAEDVRERRVWEGALGCPNCREQYPVRDGYGDLRAPPRTELPPHAGELPVPGQEDSIRIGALLGVTGGGGQVLLIGDVARHAIALAELIDDVEIVAAHPDARGWPEAEGVSRLALGSVVPVFPGSLRGVALDGTLAESLTESAVAAVGPGGRVVLVNALDGAPEQLESLGLTVLVDEGGTVVATRGGGGEANVTFRRG